MTDEQLIAAIQSNRDITRTDWYQDRYHSGRTPLQTMLILREHCRDMVAANPGADADALLAAYVTRYATS